MSLTLQQLHARQCSVAVVGMTVLRTFKCSDAPLDIFDGYVDFEGARLRSCRRVSKPNVGKSWWNSQVVFDGSELGSGEDPRVCVHRGKVYLTAVCYTPEHGFRTHLFEPHRRATYCLVPPREVPEWGKNWCPLSLPDGRLGFIHSYSPLRLLAETGRENGVILLDHAIAPGIPEEEGPHGFPVHRGGTNGVTQHNLSFGVGHTTRLIGDPARIRHRPFFWCVNLADLGMVHGEIDFEWDPQFWVIDPTSLIFDVDTGQGLLYTTEVEGLFDDMGSAARTVEYKIELR